MNNRENSFKYLADHVMMKLSFEMTRMIEAAQTDTIFAYLIRGERYRRCTRAYIVVLGKMYAYQHIEPSIFHSEDEIRYTPRITTPLRE